MPFTVVMFSKDFDWSTREVVERASYFVEYSNSIYYHSDKGKAKMFDDRAEAEKIINTINAGRQKTDVPIRLEIQVEQPKASPTTTFD